MATASSHTAPTKPKLVVLGGGGHAKVAIETLRDQGIYEIVGFLDGEDAPDAVIGVAKLGPDALLTRLAGEGVAHAFPAVGSNAVRAKLGRAIMECGMRAASAVSPHAYVSATARFGNGVLIVAGAVINTLGIGPATSGLRGLELLAWVHPIPATTVSSTSVRTSRM